MGKVEGCRWVRFFFSFLLKNKTRQKILLRLISTTVPRSLKLEFSLSLERSYESLLSIAFYSSSIFKRECSLFSQRLVTKPVP